MVHPHIYLPNCSWTLRYLSFGAYGFAGWGGRTVSSFLYNLCPHAHFI